jgi:hypothetical protein
MGDEILTLSEAEKDRYNALWQTIQDDGYDGLTNDARQEFISYGMREMYIRREEQWMAVDDEFQKVKKLVDSTEKIEDIWVTLKAVSA